MSLNCPPPQWRVIFAGIVSLCMASSQSTASDHTNLIVLSPGTQMASRINMSSTEVLRALDCIFVEMGLTYQLAPLPQRRADLMFANGVAHAIIDAFQGPLPELPSHAAPIMPQQWAWFFSATSAWHHDDLAFQDRAAIAVPDRYDLKLHMTELGFSTVIEASDEAQLVQMLRHGRVDAVLAPSGTFRQATDILGLPATAFRSEVQATWNLVVRFRDEYAAANPDVMAAFAQARATCDGR